MKFIKLCFWCFFIAAGQAYAACSVSETGYTSCKPGYYFQSKWNNDLGNCVQCPSVTKSDGTTVYGSSADRNTLGISSCYIPTGTYKDSTGIYSITSSCYYSAITEI